MSQPNIKLYVIIGQYLSYKNGGWETEVHCCDSKEKAIAKCNEIHERFCEGESVCHTCVKNRKKKNKNDKEEEEHECEYSCECGYTEGDLNFSAREFCVETNVEHDVNFSIYGIQR
jgi:hypothetical protein